VTLGSRFTNWDDEDSSPRHRSGIRAGVSHVMWAELKATREDKKIDADEDAATEEIDDATQIEIPEDADGDKDETSEEEGKDEKHEEEGAGEDKQCLSDNDEAGQKDKAAYKDGCGFTLLPRVRRDPYLNMPQFN
jgi:hypothetical protein